MIRDKQAAAVPRSFIWPAMLLVAAAAVPSGNAADPARAFRRPVALVAVDHWLLSANQRSGTVSIIDTRERAVSAERAVAARLADLKPIGGGRGLLALSESEHELIVLGRRERELDTVQRLPVARHPVSIAVAGDGTRGTVASLWSRRLTFVDLECSEEAAIPRARLAGVLDLPFAPNVQLLVAGDTKLVVADAFGGRLAVIDAAQRSLERIVTVPGHNIRGLAQSSDGRDVLIAQQVLNGEESTTRDHVFWGGVMLNVLRSVPLREFLTESSDGRLIGTILPFGYPSKAAGDPSGLVTADGRTVVSLGGVGEVAVRTDPIRPFRHVSAGQRPTALALAPDGTAVYVANTLDDSISVVSIPDAQLAATISLGPQPESGPVEQGERLFYDARLSLDGWFSCHSCHTDAHSNGLVSDTPGDGHFGAPKRVLSLRGIGQTGPWAWNGTSNTLASQIRKSITRTMQGEEPDEAAVHALEAFLKTLPPVPALAEARSASESEKVQRGERLFSQVGCAACHTPPEYTSPGTYDVGLHDRIGNREFNPPSLRGVSQGGPYFHDSRAVDLRSVLVKFRHGRGNAQLSSGDLESLLAFLESL